MCFLVVEELYLLPAFLHTRSRIFQRAHLAVLAPRPHDPLFHLTWRGSFDFPRTARTSEERDVARRRGKLRP